MPVRLSTTISKISLLANSTNQMLVTEFYEYMKDNGCSEKHINNNLKAIMNFADNLEPTTTSFFDIRRKDQIGSVETINTMMRLVNLCIL
jgi:hypothetical protein